MYLIVGLGNPEKKYETTFHNMGFLAVGEAADKLGVKFKKKECEASVAEAFLGGEKVILARPVTYMNASGRAVKQLMAKYKVPPERLLVIYDDFDLPKGKLRIRAFGSAGTHNGMRNIVANIGTQTFNRMRIGIGRGNNDRMELKDFVLSNVSADDMAVLDKTFDSAASALTEFCQGVPVQKIMQKYNAR